MVQHPMKRKNLNNISSSSFSLHNITTIRQKAYPLRDHIYISYHRRRSTFHKMHNLAENQSQCSGTSESSADRSNNNHNSINNLENGNGHQQATSEHGTQPPSNSPPSINSHGAIPFIQNTTVFPPSTTITGRLSSISPSPRPTSSPQLGSIHSLHPQLDLKLNSRFMLMPINDQVRELQTVIRDKKTTRGDFKFYADRLIRLVVEEGLNKLPIEKIDVKTPTGNVFHGIRYLKGNCGVSIVRSGESMEQGLRDCCRSIRIGKILIESDENNQARVLYTKFPRDIADRKILLLYPIMSTGLAVIESVKALLGHGVKEDNLILLNLFSSPRAAKLINQKYSKMSVLTSDINPVSPNHFGQRYFGTD